MKSMINVNEMKEVRGGGAGFIVVGFLIVAAAIFTIIGLHSGGS